MATSSLAAKVTNIDGRIAMKSILKKQETYVTDNLNRELDQLKSTIEKVAVNVGNPNVTVLGEEANNNMGDAAAEKSGDEKSVKSYRDTIKQEKRVNFRSPHDGELREKEAKYLKEFVEASLDEEKFVKQKAKVKWLAEGDANTK
ncbi:hypothetical protein QVD17_19958 [Tagetes erecta]|uniref:Uncharacterized protein n=1 Tax=Tagetes erecta TaxID=13708 RepID=A0AAD8KKE2_TARER|nr:hypothetical protein QVD17_19958 [Tagetes erecta]